MSLDLPVAASSTRRILLLIITAGTLARLVMGGLLDLGPDESYPLAVSGSFQWSFFDHPPLAFWTIGAMQALFGHGLSPLLARLPFILMFAGTSWAMFGLTARQFGEGAGLWATGLLNLAPFFFFAAGSWIVPDGPLMLTLLLCVLFLDRALSGPDGGWKDWLAAGLFAGLALLSKYQAVVVLSGALVVIALPPNRRWLGRPQPYIAALLALLLFAPVLAWNATNNWASFGFQLGRGSGAPHLNLLPAAWSIAGQAIYLLPWILIALLVAVALTRGPAARLGMWFGLPVILLFNVLSLFEPNGQPHWSMAGWLFLFPALGRLAADSASRGRRWPAILAVASALSVSALAVAGVLLFSDWRIYSGSPQIDRALADATSWTGVRDGLSAAGLIGRPNTFLAATNWLDGGRLAEAVRPDQPVAIFGNDPRGFAFLGNLNARLGQDAIVVVDSARGAAMADFLRQHFESVDDLGMYVTSKGGAPAFGHAALLAHNFRTPVDIPYGPWATSSQR